MAGNGTGPGGTPDEIAGPPARTPAKRRSSSCTTAHLPQLAPDLVQHGSEGRLDLDFQIVMSVAPHVREYREQPEAFRWLEGRRRLRYTPDGLAGTTLGRFYFEIKPVALLARDPDFGGRLAGIRAQCALRRAGFEILTEEHIRSGALLANSISVWSAAQAADPADVQRACARLRHHPLPSRLRAVRELLRGCGHRPAEALIGLRLLAVDLTASLDGETQVFRGAREWA